MPVTMRPTGLGSGIDKDRPDYTVFTGEWEVGRIYETRGGPNNLRWFWSMTVNGPMTRSDRVATLEEAKAKFQKSPRKPFTKGGSLNLEGKAAWDDHRRRQAETLAFLNQLSSLSNTPHH
jgi:hypothetical protein